MLWTDGVHKQVLPNGLTVLVQRDASVRVVGVVTHVKAGYFDEPDEWVGISHVLEHMFFKGTERRGPGWIARETQLLGGYVNAGTIYDQTVYYTVLPSGERALERALDIHADALMHCTLDADELGRELEVVIQEAKRKLDSPAAVATETLYGLLFRVHRMRRWRVGTEAGLRHITADDVRSYYATRYTPDRVIVGIVGDVDPDHALRLAETTYGAWDRPAAAVEGSPPEPADATPAVRVLRGDVERPLARIGWRTVGTLHPDAPALEVAAGVLGLGRGSRLYRALRLRGLARRADASHYTPTEVGVYTAAIDGEQATLDEAVARALAVTNMVGSEGPGEEELARVRALLSAQWASRFESMDGRASILCGCEALGDYRLADDLLERTLAVDAAAVQRVVTRYLNDDRVSAVLYLPENGSSIWDDGRWPPEEKGIGVERPRAAIGGAEFSTAPRSEIALARKHPDGVLSWSARGADLLVQSRRGSGLATVGVHFVGPPARETAANAGISALFARAALRGAGELGGEELAQVAESLGGVLSASVGADTVGWWITVRAEFVEEAARVLKLVAAAPRLGSRELAAERDKQVGDAESARDDMFRHPMQRVLAQAFGDDSYGLPRLGEPETVASLDDAQVREWGRWLASCRAVVVAVGDRDEAGLLDSLAPFAEWKGHESQPGVPSAPEWRGQRAAEQRVKEQTALAMGFPASAAGSDDRYPLAVLGSLLSGLAGRLFERLREKRSLAYVVVASPWLAARAGAFLTYVATSPETEGEARDEMLSELARSYGRPPSDEELARARNYAAGAVEIDRQRGRARANLLLDAWVHGTMDELSETAERLRSVTREELVDVARRVLREDVRAEYAVRGKG